MKNLCLFLHFCLSLQLPLTSSTAPLRRMLQPNLVHHHHQTASPLPPRSLSQKQTQSQTLPQLRPLAEPMPQPLAQPMTQPQH